VNDDSQVDSYGDTCSDYYDAYPNSCGGYDTDLFISSHLCCACGGGIEEIEEAPIEETVCENDDSQVDAYGETCSTWFDAHP
jgi:hypothetical protein